MSGQKKSGQENSIFTELAVEGVKGLMPYQPGKPVEELEREYGVSNIIKLASNENPYGPTPGLADAIRNEVAGIGRYPDDSGYVLKNRLALKHQVNAEQITLGNGSCNVLELIIRAFVAPGEQVVCSEYAFAMYYILSQAAGADLRVVPSKAWGHDLDAMREQINSHTKVVFIANPNNPTGTWLEKNELEQFVKSVPQEVIIVIDEAYFEYASFPAMGIEGYPDTVSWISAYPNLIVTRTFSKAYGLAGLRIGYGIANPVITDLINRVRQPFNVNNFAMMSALLALGDEAHLNMGLEANTAGLKQMTLGLQQAGFDVIPSAGNFVMVDIKQDAKKVNEYLLQNGIIVRLVGNYGLANHLRISVGLAGENQRLIDTINKM